MLKSIIVIAALFSVVLPAQTFAQDAITDELPVLKHEVQACSPIKKMDARSKCYEAVALHSIGIIERLSAKHEKTAEEIKADTEAQEKKEQNDKYQSFITEAKAVLVRDFKDPSSAQWRGLFVSGKSRPWFLCGEVNAKNSYGAYIGFKRFYTSESKGYVEDNDNNHFNFNYYFSAVCDERIYESPT